MCKILKENIKTKLSFKKGLDHLRVKDEEEFIKKVSLILGFKKSDRLNIYIKRKLLNGYFSPVEYKALISLFKEYDVDVFPCEEIKK